MSEQSHYNNTAILLVSHIYNRGVAQLFGEIWEECHESFSVYFLCDNTRGIFNSLLNDPRYEPFSIQDLVSLGYPEKSDIHYQGSKRKLNNHHKERNFVLGNTELALLWFYNQHPDYEYYWIVEYDVRYSGSWRGFFSQFGTSHADLLATSLTRHEECPGWPRWKSMNFRSTYIPEADYIRGFFPIFRASSAALRRLDQDYRTGASGHYECLMPTLLFNAGFSLEDIGGDGHFVRRENINKFYRSNRVGNSLAPGTMVYRPVFDRPGAERDTLWHPVKYRPAWRRILSFIKRKILNQDA